MCKHVGCCPACCSLSLPRNSYSQLLICVFQHLWMPMFLSNRHMDLFSVYQFFTLSVNLLLLDDGVFILPLPCFSFPVLPIERYCYIFHLICDQRLYCYAYASICPHLWKFTTSIFFSYFLFLWKLMIAFFVFFVSTANYFPYFQVASFSVQFSTRLITLQILPESVCFWRPPLCRLLSFSLEWLPPRPAT